MNGGTKALLATAALATAGCAADTGQLKIRAVADPLTKAIRPGNPMIDEARGLLALGNVGLAIEAYRKVLRTQPDSIEALAGLGECYDQMGRPDLSRAKYEAALAIAPKNPVLLRTFAASLERQGRFDEGGALRGEAAQAEAAEVAPLASMASAEAASVAPAPVVSVTQWKIEAPARPQAGIAVAAKPPMPQITTTVTVKPPAAQIATTTAVKPSSPPQPVATPAMEPPAPPQPVATRAMTKPLALPPQLATVTLVTKPLAPPQTVSTTITAKPAAPQLTAPATKPRAVGEVTSALAIATPPMPSVESVARAFGSAPISFNIAPTSSAHAGTLSEAMRAAEVKIALSLPPAPPKAVASPSVSARVAVAPVARGPRLERLSLGEVALVTSPEPRWRAQVVQRTALSTTVRFVPLAPQQPRFASLRLLNAARHQGLAARTRVALNRDGWNRVSIGDADRVRERSLVLYSSTTKDAARRLAAQFGFLIAREARPGPLTILLGRDAVGRGLINS